MFCSEVAQAGVHRVEEGGTTCRADNAALLMKRRACWLSGGGDGVASEAPSWRDGACVR
jgi:hypothetical protein